MVVLPDTATAKWLTNWVEAPVFQWDAGNDSKSEKKHGVSREQTESLFDGVAAFWGRIVKPAHAEPRWIVLGRTATGLHVALIFTIRGEALRPISSRPMRAAERSQYEKEILAAVEE